MTATTYQHCYRILGVACDCEWAALRLAYRRRVRACHPDLVPAGAHAERAAHDEELRQVVLAYRLLARFRAQHGELPPPWLGIDEPAVLHAASDFENAARESTQTFDDASNTRTSAPRFRWARLRFQLAVFTAFVSGVCAAALVEGIGESGSVDAPAGDGTLALGMNPRAVVAVQGVPNHTEGSVWFYGDSGVVFDNGCVVGWESQPPLPLRAPVNMTYLSGDAFQDSEECTPPGQ